MAITLTGRAAALRHIASDVAASLPSGWEGSFSDLLELVENEVARRAITRFTASEITDEIASAFCEGA